MLASRPLPRLRALAALAVAVLLLPACDSNDPIVDPAEVAGLYTFQELQYVPENEALGAINLLATRFEGPVMLELLNSGTFILRYRPPGGRDETLTGTFGVTDDDVRFSGTGSDAEYNRFLLDDSFRLRRENGALTAMIPRTVNTDTYPDFYTGVGEVQGEVRIRAGLNAQQ